MINEKEFKDLDFDKQLEIFYTYDFKLKKLEKELKTIKKVMLKIIKDENKDVMENNEYRLFYNKVSQDRLDTEKAKKKLEANGHLKECMKTIEFDYVTIRSKNENVSEIDISL